MHISQNKLEANRANAQSSTGPKTAEGKARSAMNALKHGILARSAIVNSLEGDERYELFQHRLEVYLQDLRPVGIAECDLVEEIAVAYWRLARVLSYETLMAQTAYTRRPAQDDILDKEPLLDHPTMPFADTTMLVMRYQSAINRQIHQAHARLEKLQAARRKREAEEREETAQMGAAEQVSAESGDVDNQTNPNQEIPEETASLFESTQEVPPPAERSADSPDVASVSATPNQST